MMQGTYGNGVDWRPLTMEDLLATQRKIDALGPPPETDATLSPAMLDALNAVIDEGNKIVDAHFAGRHGGLTIHIDERLPAGAWHKGKPRP